MRSHRRVVERQALARCLRPWKPGQIERRRLRLKGRERKRQRRHLRREKARVKEHTGFRSGAACRAQREASYR